ncbi:MAG TPA: hypothetical protein VGF36_08580, partial [Rhodopila sp.]
GFWISFDQAASLIPPKAACYANLPHATPQDPAPNYEVLGYEQLCGPIDPATGYGTGWPQLGTNSAGQNLYMVDALGDILHLLEGGRISDHSHRAARTVNTYQTMTYEQLAGPITDGYGHGWPQLGGRSVTDAVAHVKNVLLDIAGETPPVTPPGEGGGTPLDRHELLTFAGTWAAPGTGYPSDVAHACADWCEEIPVEAPWSFGPIPPGQLTAPSYAESVDIAVDWACDWIETNRRTVILGGYSQGGEAAARVHHELTQGRLQHLGHLYVAGYTFGNPSRQLEHTFYAGPPRDGEGIAQFRQSGIGDDWADEVDGDDMYGGVPPTLTGEIMRDVYTVCTDLQIHDLHQFAVDFAWNCLEVVQNLDGDAFDDLAAGAARHGVDLIPAHPADTDRIQQISDKVSVKGIAAAIQAAVLGIQFLCTSPPTAPHIEYHIREVFPGQTYVGHAIQHVNDWAARRQPVSYT